MLTHTISILFLPRLLRLIAAIFYLGLRKKAMLTKQRLPDIIVIAVLGLFLILLNYTGKTGIISDFPFIFLLIMYFVGRAVTWYIINQHEQ